MTTTSLHAEWLSLIDISGPFLAEPVLKEVFPQGLEEIESSKRRTLRQAYDEWRDAQELDDPELPALHVAWVDLVLRQGLELDEEGTGDVIKAQADLPDSIRCEIPERGVTLRPNYAVVNDQRADEPLMLVSVYGPSTSLDEPLKIDGWSASPSERMVELCRVNGVRLGLVTNGERWMLVDAPVGAVTSFASWYANLWGQEPRTLQAFVNLLGVRRFFVDKSEQLPALLDESLKLQDEVTDALGEQVRRAVEVLIQRLDRADLDLNRTLLEGVTPTELYESALTVMMRIVFLLSAEERGLLLMGDERYEANYAVSTLRMQLRGEAEEILERRQDAWSRLLAIFRAVYGGIEHETMRMPALGGSLFDPDRFPFLEGRAKASHWKTDPARPLPIDNRTVLLLLDAVQLFQGRALSYRSLDVEQIGYVYEGLLERTVVRAKDVTLDLDATKSAKKPWVTLDELEAAAAKSDSAVTDLLMERTGSAASRLANDLIKRVEEADADKLLTVCHGDQRLRDRIKPYFHLLRSDSWGYPLVYPVETFMVTTAGDRRETGTHYTPKVLTEAIVKEALEPIVYIGPAEGKSREDWKLRTPAEILDLKICDPAMGSGAFLVQVCRWLSERLVEAWNEAEAAGCAVTSQGVVVKKQNGCEPLRDDAEERMLVAQRLIAERCLYGVDMNPLAVELAKLSIWLVTLAKGRPFGFLDHNLRAGDSLLGITDLDQLLYLEMHPGKGSSKKLFASSLDQAVNDAIALRKELRAHPVRDIQDVEVMAALDAEARGKIVLPNLIADALIGEFLASGGRNRDAILMSIEAGRAVDGDADAVEELCRRASKGLDAELPIGKSVRNPFHWPLEFPEVFARHEGGFDCIVGNPPFMGGTLATEKYGAAYTALLQSFYPPWHGKADYVVGFFKLASRVVQEKGTYCLIATSSFLRGETLESGLRPLLTEGLTIYTARSPFRWPGKAALEVVVVGLTRTWQGQSKLNGVMVPGVDEELHPRVSDGRIPSSLKERNLFCGLGIKLCPENREISKESYDNFIKEAPFLENFYVPAVGGEELYNLIDLNLAPRSVDPERLRSFLSRFGDIPEGSPVKIGSPSKYKHSRPASKVMSIAENSKLIFACGETSTDLRFRRVFLDDIIIKHKVVLFPADSWGIFAILQSDVHVQWAWRWGLRRASGIVYSPKRCADTFPLPAALCSKSCSQSELDAVAEKYHDIRDNIMSDRGEGLTKTHNRVHDELDTAEDIQNLRVIQSEMDQAVVSSYGWSIDLQHGFYHTGRGPRFTISEAARDAILGRLMDLNHFLSEE